tara:strand:- start:194 stop:484 length:291 start_codon:yes stop_codon:yes gene_type:complete
MGWLRHKDSSPLDEYGCGHPVHEVHWKRGEVREVSKEASEYLLAVFAECFEETSAPAAPKEPSVDRAMKPPPKRKPATKKAAKKPAAKKPRNKAKK